MAHRPNIPMNTPRSNMIMGGGDSSGIAFVSAEELKEVSPPVEALVGALGGAISGAGVAAVGSAAATLSKGDLPMHYAFSNTFKSHLGWVGGITAAFAALGALVRFTGAKKHNEWSQRHYNFLEQQQSASHAAHIEGEREAAKTEEKSAGR